MILLTWIFMAYGISQILVYGSIFNKFRDKIHQLSAEEDFIYQPFFEFFSGLISCMMCTSTWVGFFLGIAIFSPVNFYFNSPIEFSWFFDGCLASGGVWALNAIIESYENKNN